MRSFLASRYLSCLLWLFLAFFVSVFSTNLLSQELSITGKIDRSEIKVGERAVIDLIVKTSDIGQTVLAVPQDSLGEITILAYQALDTVSVDRRISEIHARMIVTAWDSCLLTIPPVRARLLAQEAQTDPFVLKVTEPSVDISKPDSIAEAKEPWALPYTLRDLMLIVLHSPLYWAFLLVCLSTILFFVIRRHRKKRGLRVIDRSEATIPAIDRALAEIDALSREKPQAGVEYKIFYTRLTDVIRAYLGERLGVRAMEMTSPGLIHTVSIYFDGTGFRLSPNLSSLLRYTLEQSDLAKFARSRPDVDVVDRSLDSSRSFLKELDRLIVLREESLRCETDASAELPDADNLKS